MIQLKKRKLLRQKLIDLLENDYCFRDYRILPEEMFRENDKKENHALILSQDEMFFVVDDLICNFTKTLSGTLYLYI